MKGIILHGGSGTRLRPLTYTDVKQLLPVGGMPISQYGFEDMVKNGITEINIVVGHVGAEDVKNHYGDGSRWGVNVSYTYQERPLGIAHAIWLCKNFVGNDDFIVFLGDNYLNNGLGELLDTYEGGDYDAAIGLTKVKNPERFGVAKIEGERIVSLVEKPKTFVSDLAIVGAYILNKEIFQYIEMLKPSWRNEYEITEAFQKMLENNKKIGFRIIEGWFKDTGTVEDFLDCNRLVLEKIGRTNEFHDGGRINGKVFIGEGTVLDKTTEILGPCYIGKNCKITDSYIGPFTSMGDDCSISKCHIEDSVIMNGVSLAGYDDMPPIRGSLIGPNSKINHTKDGRRHLKLILGRDSEVWL
ncbi:glucose-1-phosphate thymidylyltransferase [Caldiplasma sukawensis]